MSDLVTGEAVALDLRVARLPSRAVALALDLLLQGAALLGGVLAVYGVATDPALEAALSLVVVVAVLVGYPVVAETLSRGRTLGKAAMGLRVVRDDGGPVRFRHALVRGVVAVVELYGLAGVPAALVSLASERGKRVGDLLAGTVVVRERVGRGEEPLPAQMPPGLEGWARGLDLSRLPDDLALAARQYLARWHQLADGPREEVGLRLARAVAERVAPYPPPGTPPAAYLSAVLAERTRRALVGGGQGGSGQGAVPYRSAGPYGPPAPPAPPAPQPGPAPVQPPAHRPAPGGFAPPS
ncbi:RDD family protein [Vallicoccus soli]|uniref:RDD family protein n=1 Tax=Vallicoccus soli TaxID=2339232 RepID=A0A3A3Z4C0_9ACTN|nr:RDD family protein [Vallicoccus soli]RJK95397.1 RDD family protein [Vallicoccus soli]